MKHMGHSRAFCEVLFVRESQLIYEEILVVREHDKQCMLAPVCFM